MSYDVIPDVEGKSELTVNDDGPLHVAQCMYCMVQAQKYMSCLIMLL